ncbi:trace amine-associated receptor 13c-like [Boleophthalmus pectinirostris]|uniref:trace amine-associated receptor 13c-like n=1 Tax=Boleophthalmus pectinirostris TaxID=150288 RepID=UPI00242CDB64|nr:trace amine-associated receptor 13c-like [Boleophthalmus pectinirostris]
MESAAEEELCFPHLNSSCRRPNAHSQSQTDIIYTLLYITALVTTVLNLLVIIAISHFRQLHSSTNFILLSLAVSDFFVGIVVFPVESLMSRTCWTLGDVMCVVYLIIPITLVSASVGNMVLISVDRYVAICDPMHYQTRMTVKIVGISIGVCWLGSLLYSFCLMYENLVEPGRHTSCRGECVINVSGEADLVIVFIIPVSVIVVLYLRVFVVAVTQARSMCHQVSNKQNVVTVTARKSEIKAARNLGVVIVVFLICYSPYYCVSLTGGNLMIGSPTEMFMSFWMYCNSTLNPVIYALFYPWFRKAIKLIVTLQILKTGSSDANVL